MEVILASASPRRRLLMEQMGLAFSVQAPQVEETIPADWPLEQAMEELSRRKACAIEPQREDCIVVSADTLVVLNGKALGKPKTPERAADMLQMLSGKNHEVWTALTVRCGQKMDTVLEKTKVWFRALTDEEIRDYVATGEPLDKAGAYGIQGRGAKLVEKISGDYYTVVGLPVCRLAVLLGQYESDQERSKADA